MFVAKDRVDDLELIADFFGAGKLTPQGGSTYPLERAPDAMRKLEKGAAEGEIALLI